jgi:hypothetical protein
MTIEVQSDGENLIFKDYQNRNITISHSDYFELISSKERQQIRPSLEDCLIDPTEVWWSVENFEGENYTFYKYIKLYRDFVFVAYVLLEEFMGFNLNNFYGFNAEQIDEAEKERSGQLVLSKLHES